MKNERNEKNRKVKMNKVLVIFIIFITFGLKFTQAQSYNIDVEIPDLKNQIVRIGYHSGADVFVVDSAITDNFGKATLSGEKPLEKGVYFLVMPSSAHFDFLITEKQNLKIHTYQYHSLDSLKIEGDFQNTAFIKFQQEMASANKISQQLRIEKQFYANNSDSLKAFENRLKAIENHRTALYDSLSTTFQGLCFGDIIKAMIPVETPVGVQMWQKTEPRKHFNYINRHFFDNVNFSNPAVFNAPAHIFHNRLKQYCTYFLNARIDSLHLVKADVDFLLNKASASETASRYVVSYLMKRYEQPDMVGMDALFVYLSEEYFKQGKLPWASQAMIQEVSNRAALLERNLLGKTAENLKFPDKTGEMHELHENKSRYTVLWFYEPDCSLCLQETPKLNNIYDDLQVMNIHLIGINIDNNKTIWENFTDTHNLKFTNLWNPNQNPNLLYAYGTHKTPRLYILDADKKIIAKDISINRLLDYIAYLDEKSINPVNKFLFDSPVIKQ